MEKAIAYLKEHNIPYSVTPHDLSIHDQTMDLAALTRTLQALSSQKLLISRPMPELSRKAGKALFTPKPGRKKHNKEAR